MLEFYFFNVGHGDSIAIKFPKGSWGIIDCNRNKNEKEPEVLRFLKENQVQHLAFLCNTHFHEDHFKGMDTIADFYKDRIGYFLIPSYHATSKLNTGNYNSLKSTLKSFIKQGVDKLKTIEDGKILKIDDIQINLINPTINSCKESFVKFINNSDETVFNRDSIVMFFEYANKNILLTGDATADIWDNFDTDLSSDILKISHHGSADNNPKDLLDHITVKHGYSIISSDGNKRYRALPSKEVINHLKGQCNNEVLCTYEINQNNTDANPTEERFDNEDKIINGESRKKDASQRYTGYYKITVKDSGEIERDIGR